MFFFVFPPPKKKIYKNYNSTFRGCNIKTKTQNPGENPPPAPFLMGRSVALNLTFPERVTPSGAPGSGFLRFFGGVFVGFGMGHEKRVDFFIVFFLV